MQSLSTDDIKKTLSEIDKMLTKKIYDVLEFIIEDNKNNWCYGIDFLIENDK